ncbi:hypothetical protein PCL_09566 [Purpureocillium lilacinum]|uniref:Hemerythrin-like domain-containing protein n=1 Tax=Purpureocillium lilacinum TaxID=33203 RepID=A0A2U3DQL5_PURLI|nr:hypothetical protein PCL_09566 [Purpureocillium lilacinum]
MMAACLRDVDAIFMTIGTNSNKPDTRVTQDVSKVIVDALHTLRSERTAGSEFRPPTIVFLASTVTAESPTAHQPWPINRLIFNANYYVYMDHIAALAHLERELPWAPLIKASPAALVDDAASGFRLEPHGQSSLTCSYRDLAAAMIMMVEDPETDWVGMDPGIGVSTNARQVWYLAVDCGFRTSTVPSRRWRTLQAIFNRSAVMNVQRLSFVAEGCVPSLSSGQFMPSCPTSILWLVYLNSNSRTMAKRWADQPFLLIKKTGALSRKDLRPDHAAISMAQQMALAHNVILRSINAAVNQCCGVQPGTAEARDFLLFNQSVFEILKQHHDIEEEYMFGAIERLTGIPGIMDRNLLEHKDFEAGLEKFRKYVFETNADKYDGQTLKALLEGFGSTVEKHLHNEIPTLLELQDYDSSKLGEIAKELGRRFGGAGDKYRHAPLFIGCSDKTFVLDGQNIPFPPVPFFVPYIIKLFFEPRHAGSWRFNPSDSFGQPRPLRFLNSPGTNL